MVENGNRQGNSGCGFVAIVAVVAVLLVLGACALFLRFDWLGVGSVFLQRSTPVTSTPTLPVVVSKAGSKALPSTTPPPTGTPAPSILPATKVTVSATSTPLGVPTGTLLPTKTFVVPPSGTSRAPVSGVNEQGRSLALPPFKEVVAVYDPFRRVNLVSGVKIDFFERASVESAIVFSVGPLPYPQPILVDALVKDFNGTLFYEQCFYDEASRECKPQAYFLAIYGSVVVPTPTPTPAPVLTPTPTSEIIVQPGNPPCAYRLDPPLQLCITYKGGYRDEWVMIRNLSGFIGFGPRRNISLADYQLTDFDGNVFSFTGSLAVVLGPGKIVYVVTDETQNGVFRGTACPNCYSWHAQLPTGTPSHEIWEERGDVARLLNTRRELVLEVRYGLGQTPNMLQQERQKRSVR